MFWQKDALAGGDECRATARRPAVAIFACGAGRPVRPAQGRHGGERRPYADLALGDGDLDAAVGRVADVEGGADGAHGDAAGAHDEGARGVVGDGEVSFAGFELHVAFGGGEVHAHGARGVEFERRAIVEARAFVAGDGGREVDFTRRLQRAPADEGAEGERGGEAGPDERARPTSGC